MPAKNSKRKLGALKKAPAKTSTAKVTQKQTKRDVISTPTLKQIETSIQQGTTRSVAAFRSLTGW